VTASTIVQQVVQLDDPREAMGVNDRIQLARATAVVRERLLEDLMLAGVTVVDPASTFVEPGVRVGQDTVLEPSHDPARRHQDRSRLPDRARRRHRRQRDRRQLPG